MQKTYILNIFVREGTVLLDTITFNMGGNASAIQKARGMAAAALLNAKHLTGTARLHAGFLSHPPIREWDMKREIVMRPVRRRTR